MRFTNSILAALVFLFQLSCATYTEPPEAFLGNYFDITGTKYWVCSVFPDYIVYENEFWSYEIKFSSENEIRFTLWNKTGVKKKLKITKQDSLFKIEESKESFLCNRDGKKIKVNPENEDPVWNAGMAVVKGVVVDDTSKNVQVKIEAEKYFSQRESEIRIAEVDEQGRFSISIPLLNSQSVFLHYGNHRWRRIFLTPDKPLMILINGKSGRPIHFMGTNADVCYHMENVLDTLHHLSEVRSRKWGLEPMEFWKNMDSLSSVQHEFLNTYATENQCSDLFVQWCNSFIDCSRGNELGRYPFMSTKYGMGAVDRLDVDHPFFGFIESINFNDTMLLLEANAGDLLGNLDNFYSKVLRQEINSEARIHQDIYSFLFDYPDQISEDNMQFINSLSDSLGTYNTFSRGLVNKLVSIADPFKDEYEYRLMKGQMDRKIDYFMGFEYSLMKDLLVMVVYDNMKRARMLDVLDHVYSRIDKLIQFPVFKEDLENDYLTFLHKIKSLQSIDFVGAKSTQPGKELLLDIINSYQDTLIVVDFWYTACGPCRAAFEKMQTIKKQMYDVPIKFVYLCYSSTEKDWTNIVKEYNVKGDHYLLTNEQFAYFSDLFNISSAPRYVLIGKDGKIANDNFIQPQSYQHYMGALRKYL